jgi:hypothetical protein
VIERKLDWEHAPDLRDSLGLLSELTGVTWFGQTYYPGYWELWSIKNGQRKRHTKALKTSETRAIAEWMLAEARNRNIETRHNVVELRQPIAT